ncbi:ArpU family phage packaging/lysis transcriptional regulator [Bacillus cereus group sp. BfR-BA-01355]|uniref:ArpU family phage packaging/lysis transcriptional regulator n=1 Tax=Bacillus cereus group sp. BfR-BA-01355 TaxID=2920318 RepID=UPI001F57772B|nr:ArpU family phage packaging/lysis transcriptional regulator [Bacillus cereus group sp. BfR-BA-01355]
MENQTLLPVVNEKKVQKEVVHILKEYQALKMRLEYELEQDNINLFPKLRDSKEICKLKVKRIENILNEILDSDERSIIMMKFLTNKNLKDSYVQNELMLCNTYFYQKKKKAIKLIAIALGII